MLSSSRQADHPTPLHRSWPPFFPA